jgi:hypothetical protein
MAEDNASRLQAMQDAVTDAGNDVRALKVRAGGADLLAIGGVLALGFSFPRDPALTLSNPVPRTNVGREGGEGDDRRRHR